MENINTACHVAAYQPGQKYQTPSPGSGDRGNFGFNSNCFYITSSHCFYFCEILVFYDTLYAQNSGSHMAQEWCVAYGTLPVLEADKLYRIICKRKNIVVKASSSPVKKSQASKSSSSSSSSGKSKSSSSGGGGSKKKAKTSGSSIADSNVLVSDTGTPPALQTKKNCCLCMLTPLL